MKNTKLFLMFTLLLGGASAATAGFNGFYLGGQLGVAFLQGTHTYTNGGSASGVQKPKAVGYLGGINIGYLKQLGATNVVLGGELYYLLAGAKAKCNLQISGSSLEGTATLSHKSAMGGALIAGAILNPKVMMYVKVGYELDKFNLKYGGLTFQTPTTQSYTKSSRALVPGLGVLYKVSESLLVGGEYGYAKIAKMTPRSDAVVINGAQRGFTFTPTEHRFTVKVAYLF